MQLTIEKSELLKVVTRFQPLSVGPIPILQNVLLDACSSDTQMGQCAGQKAPLIRSGT